MLAGMQTGAAWTSAQQGASMFSRFGTSGMEPEASDLRQSMERAFSTEGVYIRQYVSRLYNLSNAANLLQYERDMELLLIGMEAQTHQLMVRNQYVVPDNNPPRAVVYMEWVEFQIKPKPEVA